MSTCTGGESPNHAIERLATGRCRATSALYLQRFAGCLRPLVALLQIRSARLSRHFSLVPASPVPTGRLVSHGSREPEFGNIVPGAFTPVLAKHSKSFSPIDCVSVGVDRMQRNVEPMRAQVEAWQKSELTDVTAKVVIYEAFVEGKLEAPKHLPRTVHDLYFKPKHEEFQSRTIRSLSKCLYVGVQGTGADPAIQGDGEAGRVSRGPLLAVVLTT